MNVELNHLAAIVAVPILILVGVGLVPFVFGGREVSRELRHYSIGMFIVFTSAILSASYWDGIVPLLMATAPERWEKWFLFVNNREFPNGVRNLLFAWGGLHVLHSMRLMIPERERGRWPIWKAPFYPRGLWPWKITLMIKKGGRQ